MPMTSIQVRLSEEQLAVIDRKVREGKYPNRSEAIRDYLRKAQLWEVLERLFEMGDLDQDETAIRDDLQRIRGEVYDELIAPGHNQQTSDV